MATGGPTEKSTANIPTSHVDDDNENSINSNPSNEDEEMIDEEDDEEEEEALVASVAADDDEGISEGDDDDNDDDSRNVRNEEDYHSGVPGDDDDVDNDTDNGGDDDDDDENVAMAVVVQEDDEMDGDEDDDDDDDENQSNVERQHFTDVDTGDDADDDASIGMKREAVRAKTTSTKISGATSNSSQGKSLKKKVKKKPPASPSSSEETRVKTIPPERSLAASNARQMLQEIVPSLPMPVGDCHLRSVGRIVHDSIKYSTAWALYPVGFSCDRYEFSPVHGRILKLRCSILSGKNIKQRLLSQKHPIPNFVTDGPIFRVMWGRGVDEDADPVEYPFDASTEAQPLSLKQIPEGSPATPHGGAVRRKPMVGMRVRVRFSETDYYEGTLTAVTPLKSSDPTPTKAKKRKRYKITIQYDEGSTETITHPDPDVQVLGPGKKRKNSNDRTHLTHSAIIRPNTLH